VFLSLRAVLWIDCVLVGKKHEEHLALHIRVRYIEAINNELSTHVFSTSYGEMHFSEGKWRNGQGMDIVLGES
jgi:hypothetical protein